MFTPGERIPTLFASIFTLLVPTNALFAGKTGLERLQRGKSGPFGV
jgi:hypothetical protein